MPVVNTNRIAAQGRKKQTNDLYSRTQSRVGGWQITPSGMRAGNVQITSAKNNQSIKVASQESASDSFLIETISSSSATTCVVSDGDNFMVGDMIKINDEHIYVSSIASESGSITGVTQANPAVVTSVGHGLSNGENVRITGVTGMTKINNGIFTTANVTTDTFQLSGINSSSYTAYCSGGDWSRATLTIIKGRDGTSATTHTLHTPPSTLTPVYRINAKLPTNYSELSSDTMSFVRGGRPFRYPKQMQIIPASALNFVASGGDAFKFASAGLSDYDNSDYEVLFILKDMQTYSITGSDESSAQYIRVNAENKAFDGFVPVANLYIGAGVSTTTVTSFDDAVATLQAGVSPAYNLDLETADAYDDQSIASLSITVNYTLSYSATKGSGDIETEGYVRVGTASSDAFAATGYEQTLFTDIRDASFGDGTQSMSTSFSFSGALASTNRVAITLNSVSTSGTASTTVTATLNSISYTAAGAGTTRSLTGINKADAIVIAN